MATYYNPRIITNNIEFSVDAANVKSWSGASPLGTNYGYFGGGNAPAAPGEVSTVDRIDFDNDTATASTKGPLSAVRYGTASTGNISYGYFGGGYPPAKSIVDRIDYSSDTSTAAVKGPLSRTTYESTATGNSSYGYFGGGVNVSTVDRVDYSNDTPTTTVKGPLSYTTYYHGATGNASYGYFAGGGASGFSHVSRIDYSSDTPTASPKGNLSYNITMLAATGNASYGYFTGGEPGEVSSKVDRIDYSSDTSTASPKGPLSVIRSRHGATGNTSYGYFGGGVAPGTASSVDRLDYSSDTSTAVAKGPLSTATRNISAASPRANAIPSTESLLKDMTGKGSNGTVSGATYNSGNDGYFNFDGTNDTVTFPTSSIVLAEEDFTIAFWVFADDASDNWQCIISSTDTTGGSGNNSAGSWQVGPVSSQIRFYVRNDAGSDHFLLQSSSTISDDTWYYIVITRTSGGSYKMYFNGELEATGSDGDSGTDLDCGILALGINRAYDNYWDGGIAMAQIYKGKALTAVEIDQNYNSVKRRFV